MTHLSRLFATAGLLIGLAVSASASTDQAFLVLRSQNYSDTEATMAALEAVGAHADHVFPPGTIIAYVPAASEAAVRAISNVASFYRSTATIPSGSSVDTAQNYNAWNHIVAAGSAPASAEPEGSPLVGDIVPVAPPVGPFPAAAPKVAGVTSYAPSYNQTSVFMTGKIGVAIVLPESTGTSGTYENWTTTQYFNVNNEIVEGLNFWANRNRASAPLTFIYDKDFGVSTTYEAILENNDTTWINDVLKKLGNFTDTWAYDNYIRSTYHTDWAFTYYVANSYKDTDGKFPNGFFGYSGLNGPAVIMTYDNDGWGIDRMANVARHEMGHIFGCGDEYCAQGSSCCTGGYFGYLGVLNGNCEAVNPNSVVCVMKGNTTDLCQYSFGQIGWTDSDGDNIPDVLDNEVRVSVDPLPGPARLPTVTITGVANNIPCPSTTMPLVTISKISSVKYRVDNGAWMEAAPFDGVFNLDVEQFTLTTEPLSIGTHKLDVQAFSRPSGNSSDIVTYNFEVGDPDITPPTVTSVVDDGSVVYDDSQLSCDVQAVDPDSGVYGYQYAIGTSPTDPGTGYVKDWLYVGNNFHIVATGLAMDPNLTYYFYVKAKNASDIWSASVASDGIKVELLSIGKAKLLPDGTRVLLKDKIITLAQGWPVILLYVEEPDRSAAMRVVADKYMADGTKVTLRGTLLPVSANTNNERQLQAVIVSSSLGTMPRPVGLVGRSVGGGRLGILPGLPSATGLNNSGLLVRMFGKVTRFEDYHYYISDGTTEVCINMNPTSVSAVVGKRQLVTGLAGFYAPNGMDTAVPMIQPRSMSDVKNY